MTFCRTPRPFASWVGLVAVVVAAFPGSVALGQPTYGPADPIASIDGSPVFLGELNYLLLAKFRVRDLDRVNVPAQQAAAASLVRQHLAMKSLRQQGGDALQSALDQQWERFLEGLRLQGTDLEAHCKRHRTDEASVRSYRDWETAWQLYLKNRLTEANLKRFYETRREQYAPATWDVSHLFIPVNDDTPSGRALAEQRMKSIVEQLQSLVHSKSELEAQFAELARRESDGATAADGGRLGWIAAPGSLPGPVMKAIRQAGEATLLPPVESPMGSHLVLIHERAVQNTEFADLEDQSRIRRDAADALFAQLVSQQRDAKVVWYVTALKPPTSAGTP